MREILLAEDDRNFGLVLKSELEDDGYSVHLVADGVEAVLSVLGNPQGYAMAILDIRMPKLDGINAMKIIRKINPDLPAIAISGNAGSSEFAAALGAGALHSLAKPFSLARIKAVMRSILPAAE